ncbi:MAG: type II secretion system F family protein [Planctomycetes bacterium]|nr:type II secretion system F family protein [Planctomycetota bacterium]
MAGFYGQLADLLRAGVPMMRSLEVLARQSSNPLMKEISREIAEDVAGGMSLADAMSKHPQAFVELYVSMVRAGERGGFLEDVLTRVSNFIERQDELRSKLIGSMIYPCVLLFVGSSLITMLLTYFVPKLRPFIERAKPNILTHVVFGVSDFLSGYGVWILIVLFGTVTVVLAYARTDAGRRSIDLWKLKIPVLGRTLIMVSLCRFCRILGTLLASGVPILQALRISRDSAGNQILAEEIDKATDSVQKGKQMSEPFSQCPFFPLDMVDMIAVAEESNSLEKVLVQIADTNEVRTARSIDLGVRMVEPLLLTAIAGVVAAIAIALLVPILTMSANM